MNPKLSWIPLLLVLLVSPLARAEKLSLRATDGTEIQLGYSKLETAVEGGSVGSKIQNLVIRMTDTGSRTTAVLVGQCHMIGNSYAFNLSCESATGERSIQVNQDCRIEGDAYLKRYILSQLPDLPFHIAYRDGSYETCSYQLAIVRDGTWLTDPVNGTHNFGLLF